MNITDPVPLAANMFGTWCGLFWIMSFPSWLFSCQNTFTWLYLLVKGDSHSGWIIFSLKKFLFQLYMTQDWCIVVQYNLPHTILFTASCSCSGFERRPLKHPSCPDGTESDSGPPKPPRTGTIPALVPKPTSYPLVKLVGKFYTLKCRWVKLIYFSSTQETMFWVLNIRYFKRIINGM